MSASPSAWISPAAAQTAMLTGSGRGIKVAVIDSGIELSNPALNYLRLCDDLAFQVKGRRVVPAAGWGIDENGHGTAIAGIIHRLAPRAEIGSFRVLDQKANGGFQIFEEAARLAIDLGYHIINLSVGTNAKELKNIQHYKPWIDTAYRYGVHVVSACNNDDFRIPEWPGNFPSVITVNMAKIQSDDLLFRWDVPLNGAHLVEFAARGVDVEVAWKGGITNKRETGSSFAAPHVAGLLARLLSVYPHLKPPVAKALLQEIAKPWDPKYRASNK